MSFEIRAATPEDVTILSSLATATCYEAYVELDPSRDLAEYCQSAFNVSTLSDELSDANSTFFIGELNGRAIAYAKLREGKHIDCISVENSVEIQRIYVLERFKGRGYGKQLIDAAIDEASRRGRDRIWLGVWDKNVAAQRFYEKLGMRVMGETDFSDGKSLFINLVYAKEISK